MDYVDVYCTRMGIDKETILGPCRNAEYVFARAIIASKLREKGFSIVEITRNMNRSRGDIYHLLKLFDNELRFNKRLRALLDLAEERGDC